MSEEGQFADSDKSDFSQKLIPSGGVQIQEKVISVSSLLTKQGFEPPRQLPKRSYSLEPDMATGWKPKKIAGSGLHNVFPINTSCQVVDHLIKQLYRKKAKQFQIAYLGPRKLNSYLLHENRKYENPYPTNKRLDPPVSQRLQIPINLTLEQKNLRFNSNFECGNLDAAIFITSNEYDLFMRVDTNTKGHTNWYYFTVQNGNFVGSVRFNICNFRRQKSLYQRGLRPYYYSKKTSESWKQGGQNVKYERKPLRYHFLYEDQDFALMQEISLKIDRLKTYITLTFTYHFQMPNDTVQFAYFIPYSYSRLLKFLPALNNCKQLPMLKSLSGLGIPVLEVTDYEIEDYNKKVVVVTGRIHPGQANSSFVCEGFLEYICSGDLSAKEYRKSFITYCIPMMNPDGVVAGNYRTSLFGKDLNRTFNSSRRYAFPESFHMLELIKDLKAKYKQRLNLFIDLHGHSVKKNIFMYGPEFNIQNPNYYIAKQLPKIMSSLTPCFRMYSCIFKISSQKSTTARATLNRQVNIPFTYTMESSNGFYYDSQLKKEFELTSKKLKKVGKALAEAILIFKDVQNNKMMAFVQSSLGSHSSRRKQERQRDELGFGKNEEENVEMLQTIADHELQSTKFLQIQHSYNSTLDLVSHPDQILSDDNISEGNSDSEPADEDLSEQELEKLLSTIQEGRDHHLDSNGPQKHPSSNLLLLQNSIPQNDGMLKYAKFTSKSGKEKNRYKKKNPLLPPINCLNRAVAKEKYHKSFIEPKSQITQNISPQRKSKHISISQMIGNARDDIALGVLAIFRKDQKYLAHSVLKKKTSKMDLQKMKFLPSAFNNSKI